MTSDPDILRRFFAKLPTLLNFTLTLDGLHAFDPALAQVGGRVLDEAGVVAALVLAVVGMALHWYAQQHQMSAEERVKDGKLTPAEARRQMRFFQTSANLVTLLGLAILGFVLFEMAG